LAKGGRDQERADDLISLWWQQGSVSVGWIIPPVLTRKSRLTSLRSHYWERLETAFRLGIKPGFADNGV